MNHHGATCRKDTPEGKDPTLLSPSAPRGPILDQPRHQRPSMPHDWVPRRLALGVPIRRQSGARWRRSQKRPRHHVRQTFLYPSHNLCPPPPHRRELVSDRVVYTTHRICCASMCFHPRVPALQEEHCDGPPVISRGRRTAAPRVVQEGAAHRDKKEPRKIMPSRSRNLHRSRAVAGVNTKARSTHLSRHYNAVWIARTRAPTRPFPSFIQ